MNSSSVGVAMGVLLFASSAAADAPPTVRRLDGLVVVTPSPTQAPPPGLRLRTMVRPADRLWIGVAPDPNEKPKPCDPPLLSPSIRPPTPGVF